MTQQIKIPGFVFSGKHCGIKDDKQKKDLAVILSQNEKTVAAGVFTKNRVSAAPVKLCQKVLKNPHAQMIVINSGIANASMGKIGHKNAKQMQSDAAKTFHIDAGKIFVCSTGKIGQPLPMSAIQKGLKDAQTNMSDEAFYDAAEAIRTTDAYRKTTFYKGKLGDKTFHIAIMAKGAGMIQPNMATMLCYVLTDLNITKTVLQKLLKTSVDLTLNRLTVDGDTSTNDSVIALANGFAQNKSFSQKSKEFTKIQKILTDLLKDITISMALDGEGATKCFNVQITGAKNFSDAKIAARAIANSQLVKTAIFGCDPNWGRILCAAGYSGAHVLEEKTQIKIGKTILFNKGKVFNSNEKKAAHYLKQNKFIDLFVDLGWGKSTYNIYASDLTYEYIRINAEYRT